MTLTDFLSWFPNRDSGPGSLIVRTSHSHSHKPPFRSAIFLLLNLHYLVLGVLRSTIIVHGVLEVFSLCRIHRQNDPRLATSTTAEVADVLPCENLFLFGESQRKQKVYPDMCTRALLDLSMFAKTFCGNSFIAADVLCCATRRFGLYSLLKGCRIRR